MSLAGGASTGGGATRDASRGPASEMTASYSRSRRPSSRTTRPYSQVLTAIIADYEAVLSDYEAVLSDYEAVFVAHEPRVTCGFH